MLQDCKPMNYLKSQKHLFIYELLLTTRKSLCFESDYDRLFIKTIIEKQSIEVGFKCLCGIKHLIT